jgi:hypothetical protein
MLFSSREQLCHKTPIRHLPGEHKIYLFSPTIHVISVILAAWASVFLLTTCVPLKNLKTFRAFTCGKNGVVISP